jgi:hypothetical protein
MLADIEEKVIPKALIYEIWDGKPVYYKGYKKVLSGELNIESVMGSSIIQWYLCTLLLKDLLIKTDTKKYVIGTNEPGLHLSFKENLSNDILIYNRKDLKINMEAVNYADIPPLVSIEIDIKADIENYTEESLYFQRKTEKLLQFGVQKVIWISTGSRRLLVADNLKEWKILTWDIDIEVLPGIIVNIEKLLQEDGFYDEEKS